MKRLLSIMLCAVLMLTGCSTSKLIEKEKTTIVLLHSWGTMENGQQAMRQIYKDFEEANPDVEIQMIAMPSAGKVEDKLREMLAVGKIPNLIYTGGIEKNTLYPVMVKQGYALDLMPYIEEDEVFKKNISPEIFKSYLTEDDKLYMLTDILSMCGYWYNSKMFENAGITELPNTWEKFIKACRQINEWAAEMNHAITPLNMDAETAAYLTSAYMAGGESKEQNPAALEGIFREAMQNAKTIGDMSQIPNADFDKRDNIRDFNIGKTAMYIGGVWDEELLNNSLSVAYAPFPSENRHSVGLVSACPGFLAGNTGTEAQKEASVRFLKYILSKPTQERIAKEARYIPSNPNIQVERLTTDRMRLCEAYYVIRKRDITGQLPTKGWTKEALTLYNNNVMQYMENAISLDDFVKLLKK